MIYQDVIQLTLSDGPAEGPDGIKVPTTGIDSNINSIVHCTVQIQGETKILMNYVQPM